MTKQQTSHTKSKQSGGEIPKRYTEARGGRKAAVARVRLIESESGMTINGKKYDDYFKMPKHRITVAAPLALVGGFPAIGKKGVSAWVRGGGATGQAEAIRHGLASVLAKHEAGWRGVLKHAGFLKRDPRAVERKKYGLKKARRAPQWSKR